MALGAGHHRVARAPCAPLAVCDDAPTFERIIARITVEARALAPTLGEAAELTVDDRWKGPAYAVSTPEQRALMARVTRESGLVLDPDTKSKTLSQNSSPH